MQYSEPEYDDPEHERLRRADAVIGGLMITAAVVLLLAVVAIYLGVFDGGLSG